MDMEQRRKLNTSLVLSLKPKESSLGDHGSVTLLVSLTLSTEGDVSSPDSSRTNSHPPQHLLGHQGKTRAGDLRAKLKKKQHKAKSIKTAKSIMGKKTSSSWHREKMESRLYWQGLKPSAVVGGLKGGDDASISGRHRDEEEGPAPRKYYMRTDKWHSQHGVGYNNLFYQVWKPVKVERRSRSDQGLNRNVDFISDLLVQSFPGVSSRGGATAEEKRFPTGRHLLTMPDTTAEEDSMFLNKPVSPQSPALAPVAKKGESNVDHHRPLLEAHKGLHAFMGHVERALRRDCSLPQLKQVCAKMVMKTRLLLKLLTERQENQGAYDPTAQCRLQENMIIHMALGKDKGLTGKKRCRRCELDSQPCHTRKFCLKRFCVKLPQSGKKDTRAQEVEQKRADSSSKCCPCSQAVQGASQCCSLFRKSELPWIQRIRDAYESQR